LKQQKDIVNYLLEKGASISAITKSNYNNTIGWNGIVSLQAAPYLEEPKSESSDSQIDIVRSLVVPGRSNPSELSSSQVPISITGWGIFKKFENIFQLDMNSNGRDITGKTFLHHITGPAYFRDDVVIVKHLLENGADRDLQARDDYGLTPIMLSGVQVQLHREYRYNTSESTRYKKKL